MRVSQIEIDRFRAIESLRMSADQLSLVVGNNGAGKTSLLEAIHFALSPRLSSSKISHTDFFNGGDDPIQIKLKFSTPFKAKLPDGFATQEIDCDQILLTIHKRERASPGKAFSDAVVITHHVLPNRPKDTEKGWKHPRKSREKPFEFDERLLALPQVELEGLPRSYYFAKDRGKQLKRGFSSSMASVLDDFNWRFAKEMRSEQAPQGQGFFERKFAFEDDIKSKIGRNELKKSFATLNDKLKQFSLPQVVLSFIDGHAPFDSAYLVKKLPRLDLPVSSLGSGEEMIVALLFLDTLADVSNDDLVVMIDEPELHLHPKLQEHFSNYLRDRTTRKADQVFVSTHSPYFFRGCVRAPGAEVLIASVNSDKVEITNTGVTRGCLPWSPSWGEINFLAYDLPTIEFHDELYGRLHELFIAAAGNDADADRRSSIRAFDTYLQSILKAPTLRVWTRERQGIPQHDETVTLQTFIRNKSHHPENSRMQGSDYSIQDLRDSILQMIDILRNP